MTKTFSLEIETSGINSTDAADWANEMTNVYADVEVSDVKISGNKISCKIGLAGIDDTTPDDIKMKVEEYLTMNEAFTATKISCH
ncbi:hypothetical protein [Candidatus Nitrosotenuis aquarius]|uniref:hypothetical protein n=1 Tax=Candidatus Nitrosotenuis aquarius TaxID=1846278 RepID=UPI000C1E69C3|nr:hypothetical protein [Candidatus Nitrosotenuis aquarius]